MYENPSAGKFDAHPAPLTSQETRSHRPRFFLGMFLLALLAARWLFPPDREWLYLFTALGVAATILDWVLIKNEADEKGPYTEPGNITR